jgi:hypothetical protein
MADTGNEKLIDRLDRYCQRLENEGEYVNADLVWEAITVIQELEHAIKLLSGSPIER